MQQDDLITPAEAARRIGLNRSTLTRQIKTRQVRSHKGLVRLSEVLADRAKNIDQTISKAKRVARGALHATAATEVVVDGSVISFAEAQRRKEIALAQLRELELSIKSGQLVEVDAVNRELAKSGRVARDRILTWPSRVAPLTAAEFGIDQVAYTIHLEQQVRELLAGISDPKFRQPRG